MIDPHTYTYDADNRIVSVDASLTATYASDQSKSALQENDRFKCYALHLARFAGNRDTDQPSLFIFVQGALRPEVPSACASDGRAFAPMTVEAETTGPMPQSPSRLPPRSHLRKS